MPFESSPLLSSSRAQSSYNGTIDESDPRLVATNSTSSEAGTRFPSPPPSTSAASKTKEDLPRVILSRREFWSMMSGLWLIVFLGALDLTIVATLLSSIGSDFNASHITSWLGTSYLLSVCCFTPLYGRLSDIFSRRTACLLALSLFTLGTAGCGLAPSMGWLIAARAVAGSGGGGVMTISSIIMSDVVSLRSRGLWQGATNLLFGLGSGLGGALGGLVSDRFGWRYAFLLQVPLLLLSLVIVSLYVNIPSSTAYSEAVPTSLPGTPSPDPPSNLRTQLLRIDYFGSLTLVLAISSLLLGFSLKTSEELAWRDPRVAGLLVASPVFSIIFVYVEKYWASEPVLPIPMLQQRTPAIVAILNFLMSFTIFSILYNVPLYFSTVQLATSSKSGSHLVPNSVAASSASLIAGFVIRRTGRYKTLTILSCFSALVGCLLLATFKEGSTPTWIYWMAIVPAGYGAGSVITATLVGLIAAVKRDDMAVATGISYLARTCGQVLGVSLSGAVTQSVLDSELKKRIVGKGAAEIISNIRHSTAYIRHLPPQLQAEATQSWAVALKTVFYIQAALAGLTFLFSLLLDEIPLGGKGAGEVSRVEDVEGDGAKKRRVVA